jgi:uncharacterized protein with PIN domain
MIVIDTSALLAILNHEPERSAVYEAIAAAERRLVSAMTYPRRPVRSCWRAEASTDFTTWKIFFP